VIYELDYDFNKYDKLLFDLEYFFIRENLDPYGNYTDTDYWHVLETAQLKERASKLEGQLDFKISAGGGNFSIGERQLFCLARALLKKTKILLVDEATANVDPITDDIIQNIIRNEFADCTTLTIAHRLNTIVDSNKIIVMDNGTMKEFDSPRQLLSNNNSIFHKMASETSIFDELVKKAA
jgi:ABC-type multidrug transport system fused ATPase/permease subunit